ncbi:FecR family protein [Paremcibacter congregatus]|uniref:FecR family protein n=1 Tax=Paremcibacter congregatus TaxID=2043170 RepID=UPI0030EBFD03|tara:strand:- start:9301 stop:10332 length:1032 start_codon:yes stop_codon:yes gene_type:complete
MVYRISSVSDPALHEQACYWHAHLGSGLLDQAEKLAFEQWLAASPLHQAAFDNVSASLDMLEGVAEDPEILVLRRTALKNRPRRNLRLWQGIAASFILFLFLLIGQQSGLLDSPPQADTNILQTAVGERSTVTLADGSVIDLNTDTLLRTHLTPERRLVILAQGQAVFEVAKDPQRPFIVLAGDQRITAVGTQFEVRTDAKGTAVTLLEGKVLIDEVRIDLNIAKEKPKVPVVELTPGNRYIASVSNTPVVEKADLKKVTSWREGRVDFKNEILKDVVVEINRYSTHKVQVSDPTLMELRVSGSFKTGSMDNFLIALSAIYPVEVIRKKNKSILQWKGQDDSG